MDRTLHGQLCACQEVSQHIWHTLYTCMRISKLHHYLACGFWGQCRSYSSEVSTCNKVLSCSPGSPPRLGDGACACAACRIFRSWLSANPLSMPAK